MSDPQQARIEAAAEALTASQGYVRSEMSGHMRDRYHQLARLALAAADRVDPTKRYETSIEYGHLATTFEGGVPLDPPIWLHEPRGRNYATHQRTVLTGPVEFVSSKEPSDD